MSKNYRTVGLALTLFFSMNEFSWAQTHHNSRIATANISPDQIVDKLIAQSLYNRRHRKDRTYQIHISASGRYGSAEASALRVERASGSVNYSQYELVSGSNMVMKKIYTELSNGEEALNSLREKAIASDSDLPGALSRDNYSFTYLGEDKNSLGEVQYEFHIAPLDVPRDELSLLVEEDLTVDGRGFQPVRETGVKVTLPRFVKAISFDRTSKIEDGFSIPVTLEGLTRLVFPLGSESTHIDYTEMKP